MKLISKIAATVLAASLVVPAAFAATTSGTPATTSHVAQMKKMAMKKGMKKASMKKGMKKMSTKKGMKKAAGKKMGMKKMGMKKSSMKSMKKM